MRKIIAAFIILLFASSAYAATYDVGSNQVKYGASGGSNEIRIDCHSGDCIDGYSYIYWVEACGDATSKVNPTNRLTSGSDTDYLVSNIVPEKLSCGLGTHNLVFEIQTTGLSPETKVHAEGTLKVTANDMSPHKGKYLFVEMDLYSNDKIREFILTDDKSKFFKGKNDISASKAEPGDIFLEETDWGTGDTHDDYGIYKPKVGEIISNGNALSSLSTTSSIIDYDGGLNDDGYGAKEVWEKTLSSGLKDKIGQGNGGCTTDVFTFNSCTPLHKGGNYQSQGEIIKAYTAKYWDPSNNVIKGWEGPYWHICREGNLGPSGTGRVVDTNQGDPGGLYKCDTGQWFEWQDHVANVNALGKGNWIPINQCNNDIDDNGNEKADADGSPMGGMPKDPQCANRYNVNWETQAACTAGETRTVTRNVLVGPPPGHYEQKKFFQKCMDSKLTSGSTVTWHEHLYRTEESFEYNSEQYGIATPTGYYNNWSLAGEGGINKYFDNTGFKDASNYPDKADEVYVPSKSMTGQNYVNLGYPYYLDLNTWPSQGRWEAIFNGTNNGTIMKWGSGWVREGPHTQTLAHAKQGFLGSSSAVMCSSQGTAGSDYISGVNCSDSTPYGWIAVNKYRSKYSDQIKWRDLDDHYSYNSLIDVDTFVENESQPENKKVWTGGWVPNCGGDSVLKYDITGWRCDASSSRGKMKVNFYRHSSNIGGKYTGFQINKSQLMKWKNAHPNIHAIDGSADGEKKLTVRARCWQGNASNMPADANKMIKLQAKYSGNPPLVVAGKIPSRSVPNQDTYTCVYGIQQVVYPANGTCTVSTASACQSSYIPSQGTTLYYSGNKGTYTFSTGYGKMTLGYITEGTDQTGYVRTVGSTIPAPSQSWFNNNEDAVSRTGGLFTHFYPGGPTSAPRHPVEDYCRGHHAPGC